MNEKKLNKGMLKRLKRIENLLNTARQSTRTHIENVESAKLRLASWVNDFGEDDEDTPNHREAVAREKRLLSANKKDIQELEIELNSAKDEIRDAVEKERAWKSLEANKQRDHEREMKIIDHEIARENRLAAEAAAKVAATAQEQASQSIDSLLKGLQGNGEG